MNAGARIAAIGGVLLLLLQIASPAHAYKVEKICEEKQTKRGLERKCKSVLVQGSGEEKKDALASDKKDAHSKDAKAKDTKAKDPHAAAPAKH